MLKIVLLKERLYKYFLGIVFLPISLYSQTTPTIVTTNLSSSSVCAGTTVSVAFTTSNLDITKRNFTVQLSAVGGAFTTFTTLATNKISPISVVLPSTTLAGDYKIRVVTDTTGVTTTPSSTFSITRPPTAKLTGDTTITAGATATLTITFTGNGPWIYTFTNTNTGTASTNIFKGVVQPVVTTTYNLQSVSNICGVGSVSGGATVTVVPRISATYTATTACVGANIEIPFAILGTVPSTGVTYTAQLSDINGNFTTPTVIGTDITSPISAKIPNSTVAGSNYKVRVVTNITSTPVAGNSLTIRAIPSAILSGNSTIDIGGSSNLTIAFTGEAPWNYELSDGKTGVATVTPSVIPISPTTNTTYTLKSVSNICGVGTVSGTASITVVPRISVADVSLGSICVGTTVSLPFIVTGSFGSGTIYTAQLSDAVGSFANTVNVGSGTNSPLVFTLPSNLAAGTGYKLRVIANTTSTAINSQAFTIKPLPTGIISGSSTVNFGETTAISLVFTGEAPWSFTLSNGTTGTADRSPYSVTINPAQTSSYQLSSVKNICGLGVAAGTATVTVIPRLVAENFTTPICIGKSFDVKFSLGGVLPANVTYQVQLSDNTGNFTNPTIIGNGSKSPIAALLPTNLPIEGNYKIRVVAIGAVISSIPTNSFQIGRLPTATLSGGGDFAIKPGDEITLIIKFTGDAPWTYVLSDDATATVSTTPVILIVKPTLPTTYTLKSISNVCGEGTVAGSAKANVIITSINNSPTVGIEVSPNPFTNRLFIKTSILISQYQLIDFTGRIWQEEKTYLPQNFEVVTPTLSNGMYVLRLYDGQKWYNYKLVKY